MEPQRSNDRAERHLAVLAARQHGLLTRQQLTEAGLGAGAIKYRLGLGRLHAVHKGVYALGHVPTSPLTAALAAVLACGPRAVLSHRSAAALWGVLAQWPVLIEVTVASERRRPGVTTHRSRLTPADRTTRHGVPVTTPARTLVDLADLLDDSALRRAVGEARIKRLVRDDQLKRVLAVAGKRRARSRLAPLLDLGPTRSVLEDAFLALVQRHRLPRPLPNCVVAGYEVDMLWPAQRVIVELDGRAFHDHGAAFERDRERDADLTAAGYRVLRITWRRLRDQPERELERLRRLLASSS